VALVNLPDLYDFLGLEYGTDIKFFEPTLAQVTTLFEKACGRERAPFGGPFTNRAEIVRADPWSSLVYLDYPIDTITSIGVGLDVSAPDETLTPGSATSVVWVAGSREIMRTDGGYWGRSSPRWVKVVYNTLAHQPDDAKLAVMRRVARIYNERGKEGFSSILRGARQWTMSGREGGFQESEWNDAVRNHSGPWVR
jgi:hypothetical protein